jgi:hypothetical protein
MLQALSGEIFQKSRALERIALSCAVAITAENR